MGEDRCRMVLRFGLLLAKLAAGPAFGVTIDLSPDRPGCLLVAVRLDQIGAPAAWVPSLETLLDENPFHIDLIADVVLARHLAELQDHIAGIDPVEFDTMAKARGMNAIAWQDGRMVIELPTCYLLQLLDSELARGTGTL